MTVRLSGGWKETHTHTNTHAQREGERERGRERGAHFHPNLRFIPPRAHLCSAAHRSSPLFKLEGTKQTQHLAPSLIASQRLVLSPPSPLYFYLIFFFFLIARTFLPLQFPELHHE